MNQVNARHEIIREWRSLPKDLRQTDEQAAAFAMQIKDKYKFSSGSTDPYQTVKDWLLHYLSITRRLERNVEGEAKMSGEKSSDAGLSAAERKTLRSREAEVAIAEHESAQKAFHANLERLREERLRPEAAAGPTLYPAPELPDDTPVENVQFTTRIRKTLHAAGMKTIGDVREVSDAALLSLPDFGSGSLSYLREALGLPSTDGVRPKIKKPT
jgi:RNA polymerase alpha subunit